MLVAGCGSDDPEVVDGWQSHGDWAVSDDIGGGISLAVQVQAGEQRDDTQALSVRCRPGRSNADARVLEVFAVFRNVRFAPPGDLLASTRVVHSVPPGGDENSGSDWWPVSADREGLISPRPVFMAQLLAESDSDAITLSAHDMFDDPVSQTFSLDGADRAVGRVLRWCGH